MGSIVSRLPFPKNVIALVASMDGHMGGSLDLEGLR